MKKAAVPAPESPMDEANTATGRALYLSHFTPSMMSPHTLEAMLVQREPVLARGVDNIVDSLRSGSAHHALFVGPRGIGKTHLIALIHHRLLQTPLVQEKALIAWMREEEWGVTSFFELVMRLLRTLAVTHPELNIPARTEAILDMPLKTAEREAEALLLEVLGDKRLVVLLENLDDLFEQLGDKGQKALRAFLQNHHKLILCCTSPALFAGVSLQKSAFYGFFDIELLKELDFEDVVQLLHKVATEREDTALADFIATPEGRSRIRAVHHLAEGNPRIYIIFAQFLSKEALDALVPAFMHTLDELTPYYQARMKDLSGQQRKIVEYLVNYRGAAPVKQIAKNCFITQQTCSSQLKLLRERRYVRAIEQGRESYYELCEPLMRLCMEVKQQRGEPIGLFVEMLQIWYSESELQDWLQAPQESSGFELRYVEKALEGLKKQGIEPRLKAQIAELKRCKGKDEELAIYREIAATKSSNKSSETIRKLILLQGACWPEFCQCVEDDIDGFESAFKVAVNIFLGEINRKNAIQTYRWVQTMHLGYFNLGCHLSDEVESNFVLLLAKYPAHAVASFLNPLINPGLEAFERWFSSLLNLIAAKSASADGKKTLAVWARMFPAYISLLESKNEKALLELPVEERKLLLPLLARYQSDASAA